jgi:hypothetical protein
MATGTVHGHPSRLAEDGLAPQDDATGAAKRRPA